MPNQHQSYLNGLSSLYSTVIINSNFFLVVLKIVPSDMNINVDKLTVQKQKFQSWQLNIVPSSLQKLTIIYCNVLIGITETKLTVLNTPCHSEHYRN